jgi:flagella basal body P-ring formation protein FlgA
MMLRTLAFAVLAALLPSAVLAQPATQVVAGSRVAAVADKLAFELVTDPDKSVTSAFAPADQTVPSGEVSLTAGAPQVTSTFISVPVTLAVDGKVNRTLLAGYRVKQFIHTAVAARDLDPGTVLTADDVTTERVPFMGRQPVDVGSLVGRKLRTMVPKGGVVYFESTGALELVRGGATVVLVVRDGGVALTADVVARNSGALGDMVTVYNPQTRKTLSGIVTGPNRVELTLPGATD